MRKISEIHKKNKIINLINLKENYKSIILTALVLILK